MAPGSTQRLKEISTRKLSEGKGGPVRKSHNLTAICELTVQKMWEPRRLTTLWASTVCYRDSFTSTFTSYGYITDLSWSFNQISITSKMLTPQTDENNICENYLTRTEFHIIDYRVVAVTLIKISTVNQLHIFGIALLLIEIVCLHKLLYWKLFLQQRIPL
jgi:hypothetical protein